MLQNEIRIGQIVGLGNTHRRGFYYTGQDGRVIRKQVTREYSKRADSIEVVLVDEEGHDTIHEDTEYNRKWNPEKIGKPRTKIIKAKHVGNIDEIRAAQEIERQFEEERQRKVSAREAYGDEIAALILGTFKLHDEDDPLMVRTMWNDEENAPSLVSVTFKGATAQAFTAVLRALEDGRAVIERISEDDADADPMLPEDEEFPEDEGDDEEAHLPRVES